MNDNQLISMLMNGTDLEEVGKIEVEPIVVQSETLLPHEVQKVVENPVKREQDPKQEPKQDHIKLSDYVYALPAGDSSMLETCAIPDYRLAKCCANCAFSVYDPVLNSARCVKWNCCIVPVYYCDEHKDPKDLISEDSEVEEREEYKEESELEILSEEQPAGAIITEQPTATLQEVVSPLDLASDNSTLSLANDSLPPLYDGYGDKELFLAASTNVPPFEPEVYKLAYIKKKYLQLYKEKYGSFEGAIN